MTTLVKINISLWLITIFMITLVHVFMSGWPLTQEQRMLKKKCMHSFQKNSLNNKNTHHHHSQKWAPGDPTKHFATLEPEIRRLPNYIVYRNTDRRIQRDIGLWKYSIGNARLSFCTKSKCSRRSQTSVLLHTRPNIFTTLEPQVLSWWRWAEK